MPIGSIIANEGKRFQAYGLRDGTETSGHGGSSGASSFIFLGDYPTREYAKKAIVHRAISYRDAVLQAKRSSVETVEAGLKNWSEAVGPLCCNHDTAMALSAQFVGPMLEHFRRIDVPLSGLGGIHFFGPEKNIAPVRMVSESVWGSDYSFRWDDFIAYKKGGVYDSDHSGAKLEAAMVQASNTGCVLTAGDKTGVYLASDMCSIVQCTGFSRTDSDRRLIEPAQFDVLISSFGLKSPTQYFVDAGGAKPIDGIMHRILSIPVPEHEFLGPDTIDRLRDCAGVPGQIFVDRLHNLGDVLPGFMMPGAVEAREYGIRNIITALRFERPDTRSVQTSGRLSSRLTAISLAGEMACFLGLLTVHPDVVTSSVVACAIRALIDMDQNMPASFHHQDSIPLSQRPRV